MSFASKAISFYKNLTSPDIRIPENVEILNPMENQETIRILREFYEKYYNDDRIRIFLIGINPGRFGGGITGIPFTDPVNLEQVLGIRCDFEKRHELSSRFIYDVIEAMGGPGYFFGNFYLTAISPLGFTSNNKNLNYYDVKSIMTNWKLWISKKLKEQIGFGARTDIAFSLGQGKNFQYLRILNDDIKAFDKILPLPHPRWVMQYRYKKRDDFVREYVETLTGYLT
jgi:hypothetical protein